MKSTRFTKIGCRLVDLRRNPVMRPQDYMAYRENSLRFEDGKSLAEIIKSIMLQPRSRVSGAVVRRVLAEFIWKYKGTPREQEARDAVKGWIERNIR